jgi:hypothetical protein
MERENLNRMHGFVKMEVGVFLEYFKVGRYLRKLESIYL